MVLVLGQYSTGMPGVHDGFTQHRFHQAEYPGLRVGPEPTTDKFVAIMAGPSRQQLPGAAPGDGYALSVGGLGEAMG
eukprot:Skav211951  [mRNA]  locus=scaffold1559:41563:42323:- [translate_table: standard]